MSAWTHIDLFKTLSHNTVLHYLLFCSNHYSFGHWELLQVGSWVPSTSPHPYVIWAFPHFLPRQHAPGSSCVFPDPVPEWGISPRSPGALYQRIAFRNQDLGPACIWCSWNISVSGPFQQTELGKMCLHANSCTHVSLVIFICIYPKLTDVFGSNLAAFSPCVSLTSFFLPPSTIHLLICLTPVHM